MTRYDFAIICNCNADQNRDPRKGRLAEISRAMFKTEEGATPSDSAAYLSRFEHLRTAFVRSRRASSGLAGVRRSQRALGFAGIVPLRGQPHLTRYVAIRL